MLDLLIKGGTVVDGTGAPGRVADVAVRDGRITAIGDVDEEADKVINAEGMVVSPGFVDPHTHYDAQLLWDPAATPSNLHGVTSIMAGNCGFTLAPIKAVDADYMRRLMAKVEGMDLAALENGIEWNWSSFAEYLGRLEGNIGVNAGFLVGHCALRRFVMGPDSGNEATSEQIEAMQDLLRVCIESGGVGFSSSQGTHEDGDGNPVPSRAAAKEEILALCDVVAEYPGTTLEFINQGCLKGFDDDDIELMTQMSLRGQRPINWNVLTVDASTPERHVHQLEASRIAESRGARVVPLTMPFIVGMNMSFATFCGLNLIPGWGEILGLPISERIERLRDPETRRFMDEQSHSPEAGVFSRLAEWDGYRIGDTIAPENEGLKDRVVRDIAAERGTDPFDTLLDIVIADELHTVLWPGPPPGEVSDEAWQMRKEIWESGYALIGGSDAGAHLDRMMGTVYPTALIADCLRGHKLLSIERAVQLLTDAPARLFGLKDRGRVEEGWHADLVVFDPETVGAGEITMRTDLPANGARLWSDGLGIRSVIVNGVEIVHDGEETGELPGILFAAGRDTETAPLAIPGH